MAARRWRLRNRRPLHEATRRALCRVAFLFAAALPVVVTLCICAAQYLPSYQRARIACYQQQLSAASGCKVEITAVELRAPNRRLIHGIKIHHPETGEIIARVQTLDVYESAAGYALRWTSPEVSAEHLVSAYRLLHEHILCRPSAQSQVTVAWLNGLTLVGGTEPPVRFRSVRLELKRQPAATEANLAFALDGVAGQPATLAFQRRHEGREPTTHIRLVGGGQRLPGHWVTHFAPEFCVPGASASFTGQFELAYNLSSWNLRGAGQLLDLDAATWMERPLLSGFANLDVSDLVMSDDGLKSVAGHLSIQDGRVHDDLIAAANHVGIEHALGNSKNIAHPFTQLALEFGLNSGGLCIKPSLADRAIAIDELGILARQFTADAQIVPLHNVLASLTSTSIPQPTNNLLESPTACRLVQWLPRPVIATASDQTSHQASQ